MREKSLSFALVTAVTASIIPAGHADAMSSISDNNLGSSTSSVSENPESGNADDLRNIADQVDELNKRYAARGYDGTAESDSVLWIDRSSQSRIVVVAPHATNHYRNGEPKPAEAYTGAMAEVLAERLNASVLTTTGKVSDWGDDWEGRDDEFTRVLHRLPEGCVVVDLHGMANSSSDSDLSLGTGNEPTEEAKTLTEGIRDAFVGDTVIDHKFTARSPYTVTDHMQKRGCTAIQVEVNKDFRDPVEYRVGHTILGLEKALRQ